MLESRASECFSSWKGEGTGAKMEEVWLAGDPEDCHILMKQETGQCQSLQLLVKVGSLLSVCLYPYKPRARKWPKPRITSSGFLQQTEFCLTSKVLLASLPNILSASLNNGLPVTCCHSAPSHLCLFCLTM